MNNEISIETNAEVVINKFADFSLKEMNRATRTALRKGAGVIAKNTKKNLRKELPAASKSSGKYNDRLIDGVRYYADKKGDFAKVHIMGIRRKGSGTFRLRFFEKGTKVRYHKKNKKSVGRIKAYNFFSSALTTSHDAAYSTIEEQLIKTIEKINEKKING